MAISLRLSPDEENLIREYASMMNLTVSELVRSSVLEQIEDKLDLELAEEAYEDYLENSVTYSFDQVKKDLGL
ncbi:MAG: CopG family transcriptional regulator [Tissierellia bacterium]|nr:CopG family transcriptional regulator [Tissierellia bacterium]